MLLNYVHVIMDAIGFIAHSLLLPQYTVDTRQPVSCWVFISEIFP